MMNELSFLETKLGLKLGGGGCVWWELERKGESSSFPLKLALLFLFLNERVSYNEYEFSHLVSFLYRKWIPSFIWPKTKV